MAAAAGRSYVGQVSTDGSAVIVVREDGKWRCSLIDDEVIDDLQAVLTALRRVSAFGPVFAMVAVDDEFFVIVRLVPGGASLLLSDVYAGLDYDLAADVLEMLQASVPEFDVPEFDIDEELPVPRGELGILADVGVPNEQMSLLTHDEDMYADEQLQIIAESCGFAEQYAAALEAADQQN